MKKLFNKIAIFFITLYCKTWRIKRINYEYFQEKARNGEPFIVPIWHDQLIPLAFSQYKTTVGTIASQSKDGELIAKVLKSWGFTLARGSSTRGGARAIVGAKRILEEQKLLAITVDGPTGPRHSLKSGVIFISKKTEAPVVPTFVRIKRYIKLKTWDKLLIPLPFTKIEIIYTAPVTFSPDLSEEAIEADRITLENIMLEKTLEYTPDII